jgi:hypothetical protein
MLACNLWNERNKNIFLSFSGVEFIILSLAVLSYLQTLMPTENSFQVLSY